LLIVVLAVTVVVVLLFVVVCFFWVTTCNQSLAKQLGIVRLQEVARWEITGFPTIDYVDILTALLGAQYRVAVRKVGVVVSGDIPVGPTTQLSVVLQIRFFSLFFPFGIVFSKRWSKAMLSS
jgi:hypothetical protein